MQRGAVIGLAAKGNIQVHSHTCALTRVYTYTHTGALTHALTRTYTYVHLFAWCTHTYADMHTHTHSHIHAGSNIRKLVPFLEVQVPQGYISPLSISPDPHITSQSPRLHVP